MRATQSSVIAIITVAFAIPTTGACQVPDKAESGYKDPKTGFVCMPERTIMGVDRELKICKFKITESEKVLDDLVAECEENMQERLLLLGNTKDDSCDIKLGAAELRTKALEDRCHADLETERTHSGDLANIIEGLLDDPPAPAWYESKAAVFALGIVVGGGLVGVGAWAVN